MELSKKLSVFLLSISFAGLGLIQSYEATVPTAYLDAVGVPTICTGHTKGVTIGMKATRDECTTYLKEDVSDAGRAINRLVKSPLTQDQYDSLLSFTFNVGEGNLAKSTLLKKLNNQDYCGAGYEFRRWNKAKGKVLKGLTKRRALESIPFIQECNNGSTIGNTK